MKVFNKSRSRTFFGWLVAVLGVINLLSSLFPVAFERRHLLSDLFTVEFQYGGRLTTVFLGFLLIIFSPYIFRGKKTAFYLIIAMICTSAVTHLIKGLDWEEAVINIGVVALFLSQRKYFLTRSDPEKLYAVPKHLSLLLVTIITYGLLGFWLLDRHFHQSFQLTTAITDVASAVLTFYEPTNTQLSYHASKFVDSLYMGGIIWYVYALVLLLSPVIFKKTTGSVATKKAQAIADQYGQTPLAFFCLNGEKEYFFFKDSFLAYQNVGRVCVVLGDPIGPKYQLVHIIESFKKFAEENDWIFCFYQTCEETLRIYRQLGFIAIAIGQESVVQTNAFSLEGSNGKDFRNVKNKLEKVGFNVSEWEVSAENSSSKVQTLKVISDAWLDSKKSKEMRFSLGNFSATMLAKQHILVTFNEQHQAIAFVTLIPTYGNNEVAIDLMRHLPNLPNGTMDYLFIKTILWAKDHGITYVNLGLSPLVGVGKQPSDSLIEKLLHVVYRRIVRRYNFQGLHAFKQKFKPRWQKKFLVYTRQTDLPLIGKALLELHG